MFTRSLLHRWSAAAFIVDVAALIAVDVIAWRRTRPLRTGDLPPRAGRAMPREVRSSRTTFLAGTAGVLLMACGLTSALGWGSLVLIAAGAFVAVTGLAGRVRMIGIEGTGLVIRYAARPSVRLPWAAVSGIRAPRTPLGGWRLIRIGRSHSLMPSDLLGNEWLLVEAIRSTGLLRHGRRWMRPSATPRLSRRT
jgi:hypothetical protein